MNSLRSSLALLVSVVFIVSVARLMSGCGALGTYTTPAKTQAEETAQEAAFAKLEAKVDTIERTATTVAAATASVPGVGTIAATVAAVGGALAAGVHVFANSMKTAGTVNALAAQTQNGTTPKTG